MLPRKLPRRECVKIAAALMYALIAAILPRSAHAGALSLTAAGTTEGFSLSTFATGFPTKSQTGLLIGPLGIGFNSAGEVLVSDRFGDVRLFPDTDGQDAGTVSPAQNYGDFSALGIVKLGNAIYMATHVGNAVIQINQNGTFNQTIVNGTTIARDIVVNPSNNHLFVSSQDGIWDVDPIAKSKVLVLSGQADGLAISGTTLYAARAFNGSNFNSIQGFQIGTWTQSFDSGPIAGVDGIAIGFGSLAGKIYGNTNFGDVWEVSLANPNLQTLIASGGSRGDMVKVDPSNDSLLLTQSDRVVRLIAPEGGGFASTAVPEPAAVTLMGIGLIAVIILSRRRI
jgi:hypothetical protein